MKKYAIVEFIHKEISIVPVIWISEDRKSCVWPPKKSKKLCESCSPVQPGWISYDIIKICGYSSEYLTKKIIF